jgi:hypothetical protein
MAAALGIGVPATPDERVAVDEPQYLLTAQSLARDGDLDISNQLAGQSWREFTGTKPPAETVVRPDGGQVSPHDPLLPVLLALPMAIGGWVAAKLTLALLAGVLAVWTLWLAVRRFGIPLSMATIGVSVAAASAPLAVYGQQIYPELPAAIAVVAAVTALTSPNRPRWVLLAVAVTALPWLAVKYMPVATILAVLGLVRWRRHGAAPRLAGVLALQAGLYVVVHVVIWGGVTVYASGDHFTETGQLGVMGTDPNYLFRSWRLIDLLVDSRYGLVSWQPAWLLLVPAIVTRWRTVLGLPLAAGWLVATYPALTMHGYWWPGRQLVVVLPLALLLVLGWLTNSPSWLKAVASALGAAGVFTYGCLLRDENLTWVRGFFAVDAPVHQLLVPLLADYGDAFTNPVTTSNVVWLVLLAGLAITSYAVSRRTQPGKNETVPSTVSPTSSSTATR